MVGWPPGMVAAPIRDIINNVDGWNRGEYHGANNQVGPKFGPGKPGHAVKFPSLASAC